MIMNRKGFTLVELLVMLVVLSILIAISIPNIMGILNDNKKTIAIDDASRMIETAKVRTSMDETLLPQSNGSCKIFRLSYLDKNDDYKKGPNGGTYNKNESFVLIKMEEIGAGSKTYKYNYYVRLVENVDENNMGINNATSQEIDKKDRTIFNRDVEIIGIYDSTNISIIKDSINNKMNTSCTTIEE